MVLFNGTDNVTVGIVEDDEGQAVNNGDGANAVLGGDAFVLDDRVVLNANGLAVGANDAYVSPNPICREINWDRATKEILARVEEAAIANPGMVQGAFHSVINSSNMVVRKKYSELLVKHGANVREEFITAVKNYQSSVLKHLLQDYDVDIEDRDDSGDTPLISSVNRSGVLLVRELVAAGADVDVRDADGNDILTLVQGINATSITNVLAKARKIDADAFLSEKAKKILKYLTFSCCSGNYRGENYQDDARYAANLEKAMDLAEKLGDWDEFTQKFVIENNGLLDDALSPDFGTWDVSRMQIDKILVNFAYHHGDKVSILAYHHGDKVISIIEPLFSQDKATVLSTMNSLFDGAGNLVCHSIGEYAARVVAQTPEIKFKSTGKDGKLVVRELGEYLWKNITSYLSPSDVVLSADTPVDPSQADVLLSASAPVDLSQADVTLVGDQHSHVPAGDGLTYGPASLEE